MEKLGLNLGFLIVQIANFAIIFVVLRAWVYKPLMGILEKRRLAIAKGLEDAREASEARANAEREANQIINDAQIKSNDVLRQANERAEAIKHDIVAVAEAEATKKREEALVDLEQERNRMLAELRSEVVTLSMAAAQKLIEESLTQERQRALLKEFFSGVRSGKVVVLEDKEAAGAAAEVTSALPLTTDEQDTVKRDVLAKLGKDAAVSFHVDPKILGGLVVRVGDRVIDGSVSGQLQALRQNLQ